jgi:hypothetical protein
MGAGIVNVEAGGILKGIGELAKDIRYAITGKNPEIEVKLIELENQVMNAQAVINQTEAGSSDKFVSRWRPFIGWISGFGLAYYFLVQPAAAFILRLARVEITLPTFDVGTLSTLIVAMLGLGTMRSFEKVKGVQGKH